MEKYLTSSLTTVTVQTWESPDLYYTHEYAQLYEEIEKGETYTVYFESPLGKMHYTFLKRNVPFLVNGEQYYDITTPYGYSGPFIIEASNKAGLLQAFYKAFHDYCKEQKIVTEFVRFHHFENPEVRYYFPGYVDESSTHIVADLTQNIEENLQKSVMQAVKRAEKLGVEVVFDATGERLDDFLDIYHTTMNFHEAKMFYYFDKSFFEQIQEKFPGRFLYVHALLDGKVIASRLILHNEKYAYYFLAGSLRDYNSYKPSMLLDYNILKHFQQEGKQYYILGGGYKGQDTLYDYKAKFAVNGQTPFYLGKRIHDSQVYLQLAELRSQQENFSPHTPFFPIYRS